jgi:hypothetical protein
MALIAVLGVIATRTLSCLSKGQHASSSGNDRLSNTSKSQTKQLRLKTSCQSLLENGGGHQLRKRRDPSKKQRMEKS